MEEINVSPAGELDIAPVQCDGNLPHRILVVEDDPAIRRLNEMVLMESGYQVDVAQDGAAAWDALQSKNYDLIVTDNQMPNLSGIELLQKLHVARKVLPVIMATGTPPEEELKQHPWLQIKAMLLKPYTMAELLHTVKEVLHPNDDACPEVAPPPARYGQCALR